MIGDQCEGSCADCPPASYGARLPAPFRDFSTPTLSTPGATKLLGLGRSPEGGPQNIRGSRFAAPHAASPDYQSECLCPILIWLGCCHKLPERALALLRIARRSRNSRTAALDERIPPRPVNCRLRSEQLRLEGGRRQLQAPGIGNVSKIARPDLQLCFGG